MKFLMKSGNLQGMNSLFDLSLDFISDTSKPNQKNGDKRRPSESEKEKSEFEK